MMYHWQFGAGVCVTFVALSTGAFAQSALPSDFGVTGFSFSARGGMVIPDADALAFAGRYLAFNPEAVPPSALYSVESEHGGSGGIEFTADFPGPWSASGAISYYETGGQAQTPELPSQIYPVIPADVTAINFYDFAGADIDQSRVVIDAVVSYDVVAGDGFDMTLFGGARVGSLSTDYSSRFIIGGILGSETASSRFVGAGPRLGVDVVVPVAALTRQQVVRSSSAIVTIDTRQSTHLASSIPYLRRARDLQSITPLAKLASIILLSERASARS